MLSAQIRQVRSFFVIRQICSDPVGHHHNERAIIHVQPVGAADELIGAVSYEGAIRSAGEIGFVKACHDFALVLHPVTN